MAGFKVDMPKQKENELTEEYLFRALGEALKDTYDVERGKRTEFPDANTVRKGVEMILKKKKGIKKDE